MGKYDHLEKESFFRKVGGIIKRKGLFYLLKKTFYKYIFLTYLKFRRKEKFIFCGKEYEYFYHDYNMTWANERAIEVPIIKEKLDLFKNRHVLEVGNVLSHYFPLWWDVLDKYEKSKDMINEDVVNFKPKKKYDLIVSISTLEHVGWDETPKDFQKIIVALKHLKDNCLKKRGEMLITLPIAYNTKMDRMLFEGRLKFDETYYLKRLSWDNKWKETNIKEIKAVKKYGHPFIGANGLVIGFVRK